MADDHGRLQALKDVAAEAKKKLDAARKRHRACHSRFEKLVKARTAVLKAGDTDAEATHTYEEEAARLNAEAKVTMLEYEDACRSLIAAQQAVSEAAGGGQR